MYKKLNAKNLLLLLTHMTLIFIVSCGDRYDNTEPLVCPVCPTKQANIITSVGTHGDKLSLDLRENVAINSMNGTNILEDEYTAIATNNSISPSLKWDFTEISESPEAYYILINKNKANEDTINWLIKLPPTTSSLDSAAQINTIEGGQEIVGYTAPYPDNNEYLINIYAVKENVDFSIVPTKAKDAENSIKGTNNAKLIVSLSVVIKMPGLKLAMDRLPVFVVAGQSNEEGRASYSYVIDDKYNNQENVYYLAGNYNHRSNRQLEPNTIGEIKNVTWRKDYNRRTNGQDQDESNQAFVNEAGAKNSSFGPELSFAYEMQKALDRPIGIIKYAVGGTTLSSPTYTYAGGTRYGTWNPELKIGVASNGTREYEKLYPTFKKIVIEAKKQTGLNLINNNIRSIEIVGMSWVQGESDMYGDRINHYETNLKKFITQVRTDFRTEMFPELYFVAVEVERQKSPFNRTGGANDKIKTAIRDATAVKGKAGSVSLHNPIVNVQNDGVHYTAAGLITIGKKLSKKMLQLMRANGDID